MDHIDIDPREGTTEHHVPPSPEGGLSFVAIGEGMPADASERVDDIVGDVLARRHESADRKRLAR